MVRRMKPSLVCRVDTSHGAIERVLIQERRDGRGGLGGAALGGILEQPAELDARLLLCLGRGLEADGTPGERVGPDVYGDAERPAR